MVASGLVKLNGPNDAASVMTLGTSRHRLHGDR
jgi:hypothetical protein